MNNSKFQSKLTSLAKANLKYKNLLNECEDEYHRRFGFYPSEVDDDAWIDTYHVGTGSMTVEQVHLNAENNEHYKPFESE